MKQLKLFSCLATSLVLAACGGGGSDPNDDQGGFNGQVPQPQIELIPQVATLPSNRIGFPIEIGSPFLTQMNMRVRGDNNEVPIGGTIFSVGTSNAAILSLGIGDRGATTDVNEFNSRFIGVCEQSAGGVAPFFLQAGESAGTVILTGAVSTPFTAGSISGSACTTQLPSAGREYSKQFNYTVALGPEPFRRTEAVASRTVLPLNSTLALNVPTSPFVASLDVTHRTPFGALQDNTRITVSVDKPNVIQLSVADDPATPQNEFTALQSEVTQNSRAGKALFYVHSRNVPGSAKVLVRSFDGASNSSGISAQELTFTVDAPNDGANAVVIVADSRAVYVAGTNGNTSLPAQVRVTNSAGSNIADPVSGTNNLLLEITNPGGETLLATAANGSSQEGVSVRTRTLGGAGSVLLRAGNRQGIAQIRATADRSDNNVDNGIQNAVVSVLPVVISDGRLFELNITGSTNNVLSANLVEGTVEFDADGTPVPGSGIQDGTYTVTVSAIGTDRQGNPVLPGAAVEFGIIDAPVAGYPLEGAGRFLIAGLDGNAGEGSSAFAAPTGLFRSTAGGVGPADTLLVLAKQDPENRDLESARKVTRVNSETSLDIQGRFNLNDDTGTSIDRGAVLPYILGKATIGTVRNSNRQTNEFGLASTQLVYPVSQIGHISALWARSDADTPRGQATAEIVSDVALRRLAAAASTATTRATLTANPDAISVGTTTRISACLRDGYNNPVPGVFVQYGFNGLSGTVDGQSNGFFSTATGPNGCSSAVVRVFSTATGGTAGGSIVLSAFGFEPDTIAVGTGAAPILLATPGALGGTGGRVTLRLVDANGVPIEGRQIAVMSCTGQSVAVSAGPGVTNADGETTADIQANLDSTTGVSTGSCIFAAAGVTATVTLTGQNICTLNFSPRPTGCPALPVTPIVLRSLSVEIRDPAGALYPVTNPQVQVIGNAGGINCVSTTPAASNNCRGSGIPNGTVVSLIASVGVNGAPSTASFCRWTGADTCVGTAPSVLVDLSGQDKICVAVFSPTGPAGCPVR